MNILFPSSLDSMHKVSEFWQKEEWNRRQECFYNNLKYIVMPLLFTIKDKLHLSKFGIYYAIKLGLYNLLELESCNVSGYTYFYDDGCRLG